MLRLSDKLSDGAKLSIITKAWKRLRQKYADKTVYASVTANVVLRSLDHNSYSIYFGQSFGNARAVFLGQEHDPVTGRLERLFTEFELHHQSDLVKLPLHFTTEDFAAIYKRNFARSNVSIHRLQSIVYIFSVGLENYADESKLKRVPIRIF